MDGKVLGGHVLNYIWGRDWQALLPLWYRYGEKGRKHSGLIPLFFRGPGYWSAPLLLSGKWKNRDGGTTTWLSPLAHVRRDAEGKATSGHLLNWIWGRDYKTLLPLWYRIKRGDERHTGLLPLAFWGPTYRIAPLLLSGRWQERNGTVATWLTPLFHTRHAPDGRLRDLHFLNWYQRGPFRTLFPFYWRWRQDNGTRRSLVPLVYSSAHQVDGERQTTLWPLLTRYTRAWKIDNSFWPKLWTFSMQRAGHDYHLRVLYLNGRYRDDLATTTFLQPFWHHQRPQPNVVSNFQILGGLIARDCDYENRLYAYRIFWIFPLPTVYDMDSHGSVIDLLAPTRAEGAGMDRRQRWGWLRPSFAHRLPEMQRTEVRRELGAAITDNARNQQPSLRGLGPRYDGLRKLHPFGASTPSMDDNESTTRERSRQTTRRRTRLW
jgi:hypothetical protein